MHINNTKAAAVNGHWENPGAPFYDALITEPNWQELIQEAYIVVPDAVMTQATKYTNSDVKYPHHVIVDGELVLHIEGVHAAYSRMRQMHIFDGAAEAHIERHFKELGLFDHSNMSGLVEE
ncbi:MAG: hypothetical protein FWG38_09810 [Defluviitaleaceae bacterium]|nr:hypothetical protein [Defluviitaleaceae bacterium]